MIDKERERDEQYFENDPQYLKQFGYYLGTRIVSLLFWVIILKFVSDYIVKVVVGLRGF